MSHSGPVKNKGRLTKSTISAERERKPTNKKLEKWILSYLGVERERNPHTNSLTPISTVQITSLAPDYILRSSDDILSTLYNMQEKGLVEKVHSHSGFPTFQIAENGIIKFRKQLRPIAELAINHEEQYQIVLDATEGDPKVKAELKKVPEKIKHDIEKDSKLKAELKMIPKEFANRLKNKALDKGIEVFLDRALKYGGCSRTLHCEINKRLWRLTYFPFFYFICKKLFLIHRYESESFLISFFIITPYLIYKPSTSITY